MNHSPLARATNRPGTHPPAPPPRSILFVLQSTAIGGMETHVIDLVRELSGRGVTVTLAVPAAATFDPLADRGAGAGAGVWRLDTDARGGRLGQARAFAALVRRLRALRPDVVHLHTGGATGGLGLLLAARLARVPHRVITEHDVPGERPPRRQRLTRAALDRNATAVVAISRRNAALRQARLPVQNRNFAAILNGVPIPPFDPAGRTTHGQRVRGDLGIPADAMVLGSLVRLAEGKGLDTLLGAFALVRAAAPCHLLLVGDGPLRAALESLSRDLGVEESVHFAGHQPAPTAFLDAMDAFVLAVPAGSGSIALLEAMARGLPPIITFCGPEEAVIAGETGLGAAPGDVPALAAAMSALVTDAALRERLAAAARSHVATHFSVSRVASDLLSVYTAPAGGLPAALRADAPPDPRPGARSAERSASPCGHRPEPRTAR